jgi:hypothetical protein
MGRRLSAGGGAPGAQRGLDPDFQLGQPMSHLALDGGLAAVALQQVDQAPAEGRGQGRADRGLNDRDVAAG